MSLLPPDQLGELSSAMAAAVLKALASGSSIPTINVNLTVRLEVADDAPAHPRPATAGDTPLPTAAQPGQERPDPPGGGGGEGASNDLCQALRVYLVEHDVSIADVAKRLGFCDGSVRNWLNGIFAPRAAARKAIAELLEAEQAAGAPGYEPNDEPELIGNLPRHADPRQAAAYLQKSVAAWQKAHKLNHDQAAERLGIRRHQLLHVLAPPSGPEGMLPPTQELIRAIVFRIPELQPDLQTLLAARRMFERAATA